MFSLQSESKKMQEFKIVFRAKDSYENSKQ